jgi:hypothetical protein
MRACPRECACNPQSNSRGRACNKGYFALSLKHRPSPSLPFLRILLFSNESGKGMMFIDIFQFFASNAFSN